MKVKFTREVTIFPDGQTPVLAKDGDVLDLDPKYADLMVEKEHALPLDPPAAEAKGARK